MKFDGEICGGVWWKMLLTIFPSKRSSKISFQTSPEVRHQFRRKLRQLHSGNRWCLFNLLLRPCKWTRRAWVASCCWHCGHCGFQPGNLWSWSFSKCWSGNGNNLPHSFTGYLSRYLSGTKLQETIRWEFFPVNDACGDNRIVNFCWPPYSSVAASLAKLFSFSPGF